MTKKMRGFTRDGWVRVQRTVLRRVVSDRLQALLRGDFYVRNHLGEEDYDPILKEVASLEVPSLPLPPANGQSNRNGAHPSNGGGKGKGGKTGGKDPRRAQSQSPAPDPDPNRFSPELETFIQLIAASIMIDASMRGENAGESDTRFIKKKKKLLAKTLQGPKLGDFKREVLRFDMIRRGEEFEDEEIVESEETRSSESEESESESEEEVVSRGGKGGVRKPPPPPPSKRKRPPPAPAPKRDPSGGESSSEEDDEDDEDLDSTVSDTGTGTSGTSLSQDGFSTSATSSKHHRKRDKKRLKKERKKERKRLKKERKRREKEERKQRRKREREERDRAKAARKRRKKHHGDDGGGAPSPSDDERSDTGGDDAGESGGDEDRGEPLVYDVATRGDFERYKEDLLSRVPKRVQSRFREGGFSRWGKDWLPVLELGPFDVEPGPVREMWLDMFDNVSFFVLSSLSCFVCSARIRWQWWGGSPRVSCCITCIPLERSNALVRPMYLFSMIVDFGLLQSTLPLFGAFPDNFFGDNLHGESPTNSSVPFLSRVSLGSFRVLPLSLSNILREHENHPSHQGA